jgi:hypothetical protein
MFKTHKRFNHDHDQSRKKFRRTMPQKDHSLPGMQIYFILIVFIVLTLDIRL